MRPGSLHQSSLLLARGSLFVLLALCDICCIIGARLEDCQATEQSVNLHELHCSTSEHCIFTQQWPDTEWQDTEDTTIMLQSSRLQVERHSDEDFKEQERPTEVELQGTRAKFLMSMTKRLNQQVLKQATVSLLSRLSKPQRGVMEGSGIALLLVIFVTCIVACAFFLLSTMGAKDNQMQMSFFPSSAEPMTQSEIQGSMPTSLGPQLRTTQVHGSRPTPPASPGSPVMAEAFRKSSAIHEFTPSPSNEPYMFQVNPVMSMASGSSTGQDDRRAELAYTDEQPLCSTLVLPRHEVCYVLPMLELTQLTTEGEIPILGLSGQALFRAYVRRADRRFSLEISLAEAGSSMPRATVGPMLQDLDRPDYIALEIRGPKRYLYGILELRLASGVCCVTKFLQTIMVIDHKNGIITSGGGLPLASMSCSTELLLEGGKHLAIRIQPGVDTVLVLACVLSVLLLLPP